MKNKIFLSTLAIAVLSMSLPACRRERGNINTENPAPTQAEISPTATAAVQQPKAIGNTPLPMPTETIAPSPAPSPVLLPHTPSPEISADLSQIDTLSKDLDQILGSIDTNVNVP